MLVTSSHFRLEASCLEITEQGSEFLDGSIRVCEELALGHYDDPIFDMPIELKS